MLIITHYAFPLLSSIKASLLLEAAWFIHTAVVPVYCRFPSFTSRRHRIIFKDQYKHRLAD